MSMFYAYVIKSLKAEYFYKGQCEDLVKRLKEHNSEMTHSIKSYAPFIVVYSEEYKTRKEAISREKYFKSAAGRRFLKNKLVP